MTYCLSASTWTLLDKSWTYHLDWSIEWGNPHCGRVPGRICSVPAKWPNIHHSLSSWPVPLPWKLDNSSTFRLIGTWWSASVWQILGHTCFYLCLISSSSSDPSQSSAGESPFASTDFAWTSVSSLGRALLSQLSVLQFDFIKLFFF